MKPFLTVVAMVVTLAGCAVTAPPPKLSAPPAVVAPAPASPEPIARPAAAPVQRVTTAPAPPRGYTVKYLYQAEHLPEVSACNQTRSVVLVAAGPGFENYSVPCANGRSLAVRCEFGHCRVLR